FGVEPRRVSKFLDMRPLQLVHPTETVACVFPRVINLGIFALALPFDQQRSIESQSSDFPAEIDNVFDQQPLDDVLRIDEFSESIKHVPIASWILGAQQGRIAEERLNVCRHASEGRFGTHGITPHCEALIFLKCWPSRAVYTRPKSQRVFSVPVARQG